MLQDLVNNLTPIAVLLMLLGFNDARLARKRLKVAVCELGETQERCVDLVAELEARDRDLADAVAKAASSPPSTGGRSGIDPIPGFQSVQSEGMAYFLAGGRVLRAPLDGRGVFLLGDSELVDPLAEDSIDPVTLLGMLEQLRACDLGLSANGFGDPQ